MLIKAYAKINISLDVIGKREDGYHLLKMIMQTIDLYDHINIKRLDAGINISCNKPYIPIDDRNLVYRAADIFINTYNIKGGVDIYLKKNIPVAAGLAGGSTDAAAVLKAMRSLYEIDIEDRELMNLGLKIGADVPYCIVGGTALCEGIGEKVTKLTNFKNQILIVVKPSFGVSTKEVYKSLDISKINKHPDTDTLIKNIEEHNLFRVSKNMKNVLENVTLRKHTVLKNIKNELISMGAMGALMSGSGPTIFAFFEDMLKAQSCYDRIKKKYKEVFITRTI
ncbi:4-(cytidine 5'-diphospho)-2-C-methyl-D-erythritol kinase [Clostridiaceae bacterium UIB06]|uniref:4-diphosphocytidyl-2-C-methyl-D-erythritol kinase n=1 Tax=Clostridium thailandense TaxID=2794346 RepID=A0A949TV08_9CLOT|nr:4-(cytidine 5'-diphospho)-2-C-methyl-D-erythritol kinase [Clostridium thailandense]MBV7272371.1 4-(cytidine 5'-diphospho)-2-C-methyl-D-erythritol kinase [Clostridium thailandense]MCH5135916.1 4-(cytidine 5'-diphospho)-2-C-methyl-D-erythritol kinase [Clostridiaceae bacterium UIB06]